MPPKTSERTSTDSLIRGVLDASDFDLQELNYWRGSELWTDLAHMPLLHQRVVQDATRRDFDPHRPDLTYAQETFRETALESFGLAHSHAFAVWCSWMSVRHKNSELSRAGFAQNLEGHFGALQELHAADKAAIPKLHTSFNIRHFSRYRPQTMLRQAEIARRSYEAVADTSEAPTLVLGATADYNRSLAQLEEKLIAAGIVNPVFAEIGNHRYKNDALSQIAAILDTLQQQGYPPARQVVLAAHGGRTQMDFSAGYELTTRQLRNNPGLTKRIADHPALLPDAQFALWGCALGKRRGVAINLARAAEHPVFASKELIAHIAKLSVGDVRFGKWDLELPGKRFDPQPAGRAEKLFDTVEDVLDGPHAMRVMLLGASVLNLFTLLGVTIFGGDDQDKPTTPPRPAPVEQSIQPSPR